MQEFQGTAADQAQGHRTRPTVLQTGQRLEVKPSRSSGYNERCFPCQPGALDVVEILHGFLTFSSHGRSQKQAVNGGDGNAEERGPGAQTACKLNANPQTSHTGPRLLIFAQLFEGQHGGM